MGICPNCGSWVDEGDICHGCGASGSYITSEDEDEDEFLEILRTGDVTKGKSSYAKNYKFFQDKIKEFTEEYVSYTPLLPLRIMQNCILLPIEAEL